MNKQMITAHWRILEDFPSHDGEYVVVFQKDNGDYGWPEIWEFRARDGWEPIFGQEHVSQPSYWVDLPMPK
jgi:hypothetical protein